MCGILGFTGYVSEGRWSQTHRFLESLFVASEARGIDATGFAAMTAPYKDRHSHGIVVKKAPVKASGFVGLPAWQSLRHRRCVSLVGHVRAATHGNPRKNKNNHPFVGQRFALTHNGVLKNHLDVADLFGLSLQSDCDSEVLLRLIESRPTVLDGLWACLGEVDGSMAVAVMDLADGSIWLMRNQNRPLWLAKLRGQRAWIYCSTDTIILKAIHDTGGDAGQVLETLIPIAENTPHQLCPSGRLLAFDK